MVTPSDQSARERFADELDRNFSVVASAGSGKTAAIVQRVLSIARSPRSEILPRLVVVTFANRAADEMQQRTRQFCSRRIWARRFRRRSIALSSARSIRFA